MRRCGYIRDGEDYRDRTFAFKSAPALPASASIRAHVKSVLDQGYAGSCVAQAVAQAVRIDLTRDHTGWELPSRLWIYAMARQRGGNSNLTDDGCRIRDAFAALKTLGYPSEIVWPYDDRHVFEHPTWKSFRAASDQKWSAGYYRIPTGVGAVDLVKQALACGYPVVFGTPVDEAFQNYTSGVWSFGGTSIGGHAMCAIGYDAEGVEVVNSWSELWGQQGYCKIAYTDVHTVWSDIWVPMQAEAFRE